jgi:hypothetical protein
VREIKIKKEGAQNVARMGGMISDYNILIGKPEGKRPL